MIVDLTRLGKSVDIRWYKPFDNNQNKKDLWNKASLKILCVFMSPGETRAVSNTYTSLDGIIHAEDQTIFLDYCYFPAREDIKYFRSAGTSILFGNVSNRTVEDYDAVLFSFSIIQEVTNVFAYLRESRIPIYHSDRFQDSKYPIFVAGGITIDVTEALNDKSGVMDLVLYGQGEACIPVLIKCLKNNKQYRNDKTYKGRIIREMVTTTPFSYFPAGYDYVYEGTKIIKIVKNFDWVPDYVDYARVYDMDNHPYFENKIFTPDSSNATSADTLISMGCGGMGVCSFCHEGNLQGSWREISFSEMQKRIRKSKILTAANSISAYSFNLNYYSNFIDLVHEMALNFAQLSFINMRVDVLAENPEYLEIAKMLGVNRMSAAIEGIGDRIRNHVLNKNLPFETWKKAARNIFQQRFAEIKHGMVLTSLENDNDYDDGIKEFTEIINLRDKMQVNTSIRTTFTPIVIYDGVPLQWAPRESAKVSYNQEKRMGKWLAAMKELGIRTKFNGGGLGTWFQQIIIDYGRKLTNFLEEYSKDDNNLFYSDSVSKNKRDYLTKMLKDTTGIPFESMMYQERTKDWIFPSSVFHRHSNKMTDAWRSMYEKDDYSRKYCLHTSVNVGEKCFGCQLCPSAKHIKWVTKREIKNIKTVSDVAVAIYKNSPQYNTRVLLKIRPEYETIGKQALAHRSISELLRSKPNLVDQFHSIRNLSVKPLFENFQRDYMTGLISFDIYWKNKEAEKEFGGFDSLKMEACEFLGIYPQSTLSTSFQNSIAVYKFNTRLLKDKLISGVMSYKGEIKVAEKAIAFNVIKEPLAVSEIDIRGKAYQDGFKGVIRIPWKYNPYMLLATLTNVTYWKALENTEIVSLGLFGMKMGQCKCGRENVRMDDYHSKVSSLCVKCYTDRLLEIVCAVS